MKKAIVIFAVFFILIAIAIYSVLLVFSEGHQYTRYSLSYYVLTPKELSDVSEFCQTKPNFTYDSADGPKPTITYLHCTISKEKASSYLINSGFYKVSDSVFKKGSSEVNFERKGDEVSVTTMYEFISD